MGIGLEHQATPASGIVDKYVEPTERGNGAREDASAIILARHIGLFRPPTAWMAATVVSSSSGERDALIVTASPGGQANNNGTADTAPAAGETRSCRPRMPDIVSPE
jgi:hypothetical protein